MLILIKKKKSPRSSTFEKYMISKFNQSFSSIILRPFRILVWIKNSRGVNIEWNIPKWVFSKNPFFKWSTYWEQCSEGDSLRKIEVVGRAHDLESDGLGVRFQAWYSPMVWPWTGKSLDLCFLQKNAKLRLT